MSLRRLWSERVAESPRRTALVEAQTGRAVRFRELYQSILRAGERLYGLGLTRGDRVALLSPGLGMRYLEYDYGIMVSGLVRVPLDPAQTVEDLASRIVDSGATVLVHEEPWTAVAHELRARLPWLAIVDMHAGVVAGGGARRDLEKVSRDDLASLNYTGGTTSRSKGVMLTHRNLATAVASIQGSRSLGTGDVFLNVRPLWPIAGIIVLAHLLAGVRVVLGSAFEPDSFTRLVADWGITVTSLVPTTLVRLLDGSTWEAGAFARLRTIDVGAARIPEPRFLEALQRLGPKIGVVYGLTEAPWTCYLAPDRVGRDPSLARSSGKPLGGYRLEIRAADGRPCDRGEVGEVLVGGDHVMRGYWRRPAETEEALDGGLLHTGDLGLLDEEGNLCVVGRVSDQIRTGGRTVDPAEVESVLAEHPAVVEVAVVGIPDDEWGEVVAAFVVARADRPVSAEELVDLCRRRLATYKKPRRVYLVDEIPRSHYGKVRRPLLLGLADQAPPSSG